MQKDYRPAEEYKERENTFCLEGYFSVKSGSALGFSPSLLIVLTQKFS